MPKIQMKLFLKKKTKKKTKKKENTKKIKIPIDVGWSLTALPINNKNKVGLIFHLFHPHQSWMRMFRMI